MQEEKRAAALPSRPESGRGGLSRNLAGVSAVVLLFFLLLALAASCVAVARHLDWLPAAGGVAFAALVYVLLLLAAHSSPRITDRAFLSIVCLLSLAGGLLVVGLNRHYVQIGDTAHLHSFVIELARGGLNPDNLERLSSHYDYPVWLSRAFPLYLPLRWLFGEHDVLAVQILNCFLSTGIVLLTFLIGRLFFTSPACRAAAVLMAVFPYNLFDVLNYTMQIPGTLLFLLCVYLVLRQSTSERSGGLGALTNGVLLGLLVFLLRIQRGLDLLVLPLVVLLLLLMWLAGAGRGRCLNVLTMVAVALVVYVPASSFHSRWIDRHDARRIRSHALGFMSRGWNPVTMGEYYDRYEQIDIATPRPEKTRALAGLVVSQVVRRPAFTLGVLPFVKVAKFFLVGYASGIEQGLEEGNAISMAELARAARLVFAPILLTLVIAGCWSRFRSARTLALSDMVFLIPIVACLATMLFWETSPRYSHCVHFALALIAGTALTRDPRSEVMVAPRPFFAAVGASACLLAAYAVVALTCVGALRAWGGAYLYEDMRRATLQSSDSVRPPDESLPLAHAEQWLCLPETGKGGSPWVTGELLFDAGNCPAVSLYLSAESDSKCQLERGTCEVLLNGESRQRFPCEELKRVRRVEVDVPADAGRTVRLSVRLSIDPDLTHACDGRGLCARWGYVMRVRGE